MNESSLWYAELVKPAWAPPSFLFGPVWTLLYAIILISFGTVFYKVFTKEIPWVVALPFGINLIANFIFTPLQFGLRSNLLASIDILIILGTIVWAMYSIYPYIKWVAYAQIPYLLWVAFATILQLTITYLNW